MTLIAFLGDVHGFWDLAAHKLATIERTFGRLAFAVAVGDAEPYRTEADMEGVTGPAKYRSMGRFHDVVAGHLRIPCPLFFIGGNHDPYFALEEQGAGLWWGDTHYLGRAGATEIEGVRLGFLSGIFSPRHYPAPRARNRGEATPGYAKRLTHYGVRDLDRLRAVGKVNLLVTHDWPSEVPQMEARQFPGDPLLRALHAPLAPALHVAGHCHRWQRATLGPVQFHALGRGDRARSVALYRFEGGAFDLVPLDDTDAR